jgi:hypothetical protein
MHASASVMNELGLSPEDTGGTITFVGEDPIFPSVHPPPVKFSETKPYWEDPVLVVRGSSKAQWKDS